MKFTDGYWSVKKEMTPLYAVEYADSRRKGDELTIYAPAKNIAHRGECSPYGFPVPWKMSLRFPWYILKERLIKDHLQR